MEIQCPQCQRALTIADEYAGQLMQCPMCQGQFQAPSLAATPDAASAPPEPTPPSFEPAEDPYGSSPPTAGAQESTVQEQSYQPQQQYQQGPPGQYTKCWSVSLSLKVVPYIPMILLSVVFLLSFFPWFSGLFGLGSAHLWSGAFGRGSDAILLMLFTIFSICLAWPASIVSFLFGINVFPMTGAMAKLRPWRAVLVAGLLLAGLVFFSIFYLKVLFDGGFREGSTIIVRLAFRLCWLALIFLLIEFWLEWRRNSNKPAPKIELHF